MLLLNVIRAKDRLPMYLTAISSLSGNANASFTGSLGGSYTHATGDTGQTTTGGSLPEGVSSVVSGMTKTITRGLTPSVSGTLSRNPNFTLAVLDGEKFTRGFLKPVGQRTFAHFWNQGWPPELLLYLLVQKVVVEGEPEYWNYPSSSEPKLKTLHRFGCWVQSFVAGSPELKEGPAYTDLGPLLETSDVQDVNKLIALTEKGFALKPEGDVWRLSRVSESYVLRQTDPRGDSTDADCPNLLKEAEESSPIVGSEKFSELVRQDVLASGDAEKARSSLSASDGVVLVMGSDGKPHAALVLRSPEAVLYYLGELMRVANLDSGGIVPHVCIQGRSQPLFAAFPSERCDAAAVEARSPWGSFEIPGAQHAEPPDCTQDGELSPEEVSSKFCDPGRSMQAFRLLSQLLSLQKSAEEIPAPALVRVIGE
jgi:hypothetical protein